MTDNTPTRAQFESAAKKPYKRSPCRTPEYEIWLSMKQRCTNPKNKDFRHYGGRGIKVCERWLQSFANFIADMGPRPSRQHSIDRENNDGNYEPLNCRWAPVIMQRQNTRVVRLLSHNGETLCLSEWARRAGISPGRLHSRLASGWSLEQALSKPVWGQKVITKRMRAAAISQRSE